MNPLPAISIQEFADRINEIMPVMVKEFSRIQPKEIARGKITLPQIIIMQHLISSGALKMTDIANFMRFSTPAATGIVERLVKSGYVMREPDINDRRIVRIKVTHKGLSLMKRLSDDRRRVMIDTFGLLSDKDRQDYLRVLTRIKNILLRRET